MQDKLLQTIKDLEYDLNELRHELDSYDSNNFTRYNKILNLIKSKVDEVDKIKALLRFLNNKESNSANA